MKMKTKIALCKMLRLHPQMIGNEITISGNSMVPTLENGEKVKFDSTDKDVKIGDIILYQQFSTHLTVHRVVKTIEQNKLKYYVTKGDNNPECDKYLVASDSVIGKIIGK